ncbi:MAG: response regulator [Methanomassiliicoccales archaeon]|nr:response regulator [Methanomassiliicoccales archaeon]
MEDIEIRPPRILVADDDDTVRDVTREMLKGFGMEVEAVRVRGEMVDRYRRSMLAGRRFDLVIMGVYNPFELGGGAAATMLLEVDPDARVIISIAMAGGWPFPAKCEKGAIYYLDRPFRMQDLIKAVQEALHPFHDHVINGS